MEHRRLSTSLAEIKSHYTVVVVGSGYGGGIAASRLSRAGQSVCVLERGREFLPGEFPETLPEALSELQISSPVGDVGNKTGLYDIHVDDDINVVRGCGLGGTSLINANVSLQADPRVFASGPWPRELIADLDAGLAEGYRRAEEMLRPQPYGPDRPKLDKYQALERSAREMGQECRYVPINVNFENLEDGNHVGVKQSACNNCGDCVSGCNVSAKNTTAMNYLPDAYNHGAEIFCEAAVQRIERRGNHWCVLFEDASSGRDRFTDSPELFVTADIVVLGAGSLGSTEILLRSANHGLAVSPRTGDSFTGNGDVLGFSYNSDERINSVGMGHREPSPNDPVGPCITGVIDMRDTPELEHGMVIEEGVVPGALGDLLPTTLNATAKLIGEDTDSGFLDETKEALRVVESKLRGPYHGAINNTQTYLVMGHDGHDGRMELDEEGQLRIRWPGIGDKPIFEQIDETLTNATKAIGGTYVKNPLWSERMNNRLVTVHPLGGCAMGEDAQTGVVNHKGQVFSDGQSTHPGLYVADGAIIPCSVGVNPLLTISALAERVCRLIAEDYNWQIDYSLPSAPERPARTDKVGIEFTESMTGYFSTVVKDDFAGGYEAGKAEESPFRFILTIRSSDIDAMIADPAHAARMTGTVEAPALSGSQLAVTKGTFNLLVENPDEIGTKNMVYRMALTDKAGKRYFFHGYKVVRADTGFDQWSDTTTLYITVHEGDSDQGAVVGRGILHIAPEDFARQMTTIKPLNAPNKAAGLEAVAKFGKLFSGELLETYGGVFAPNKVLDPDATPRRRRPLRTDAPEVHPFRTRDGVRLLLTRYRGGTKGPVILAPGFGNNAAVYALDTTETSFTEFLFENGYDVWLFDRRSSPRLLSAATEYTIDDIVKFDWPDAVAEVKRLTARENVQVVAHCMGSMTFLLSMMTGMSGVRSAVCSQVTTYFFTETKNRLKAALKLADWLKLAGIDTVTTSVEPNWKDAAVEAALRLYPIPEEERCNNPVCHRIWGIFGPVYRHDNLNNATHRAMNEIFGVSASTVFQHLLLILGKGHAVDKDGNDVYMDKIDRLDFPIHFIAGRENRMASPETSDKLFRELCAIHGTGNYTRTVFDDYAHLDCFVGKNSDADVFPDVLAQLDRHN